ncbi:hypothetical protein SEA_GIBBLES_54 [Gordonia phage Gibbles]|nr:hypothetical protein SEA_GIBBLES_54 [Gordonia phage Gibbles]
MPNYALAVDIETTGLNPIENVVLEVGMIIFDRDTFEEVSDFSAVVVNDVVIEHLNYLEQTAAWIKANWAEAQGKNMDQHIVWDMHVASGLAAHIRSWHEQGYRKDLAQIEQEAIALLKDYNIGKGKQSSPAVGSSVHFDRKFIDLKMPELSTGCFHYRNVDISTVKTLASWWVPEATVKRDEEITPKKSHRVLDDCRDSLAELRFYKDVFFDADFIMGGW